MTSYEMRISDWSSDGCSSDLHIRHLLPAGAEIATLDAARLPAAMLSNPRRYLDPLNFATNHAFLRDQGGRHTRLVTANYWTGYGGSGLRLWMRLFDAGGGTLATWEQALDDGSGDRKSVV